MTSPKPSHLPKAPPPNTTLLGSGFQHINFGGDTNMQSLIPLLRRWTPHTDQHPYPQGHWWGQRGLTQHCQEAEVLQHYVSVEASGQHLGIASSSGEVTTTSSGPTAS